MTRGLPDDQGAVEAFLLGSLFGKARAAAGQDEMLRVSVEEAHMRCGGPTAAELLEAGKAITLNFATARAMHWHHVNLLLFCIWSVMRWGHKQCVHAQMGLKHYQEMHQDAAMSYTSMRSKGTCSVICSACFGDGAWGMLCRRGGVGAANICQNRPLAACA